MGIIITYRDNYSASFITLLVRRQYIEDAGLGQKEAAEVFGVHQPRISDLMRGKTDKFTIDRLVNMLARIGKTVKVVSAVPKL